MFNYAATVYEDFFHIAPNPGVNLDALHRLEFAGQLDGSGAQFRHHSNRVGRLCRGNGGKEEDGGQHLIGLHSIGFPDLQDSTRKR